LSSSFLKGHQRIKFLPKFKKALKPQQRFQRLSRRRRLRIRDRPIHLQKLGRLVGAELARRASS
jgi:hypothetical protein